MFSRLVSIEDAVSLLDLLERADLDQAVLRGELKPSKAGAKGQRFRLGDIVIYRLAQVISHVGVEFDRAYRYAEKILTSRLKTHDSNPMEWVENEAQELYCLIADNQLARIFLRYKEDGRDVDVAAVKPVLFPATKCEINVFRVIRPVIYRARNVLGPK